MEALLRILGSRWFLTGIGAFLLCLLIWLFGPLWQPLESLWLLIPVIVAVIVIWACVNVLADLRGRRRERALTDGVTAIEPGAEAAAEEVARLRDRLTKAMEALRKARRGRGYLYEQPWYVIIGPPGAGKTTALLNANLTFPLAAEGGEAEVKGVGGTRLCDWYFTDQAVLIDTAGRYTTQDSDATVDRAGWDGFLDLLRRTRPRQPLNGVIVAIALNDVLRYSTAERQAHARTIRRRLKELNDRLGVRLPVYVMFTKADLLAGFMEFFDDLDRERRGQVWGTTFPVAGPPGGPAAAFATELRALVDVMSARVADRLQDERAPDRRPAILGFPAQVASLEAPLTEFLQEAFGASQLDPAAFLRGVYFVSGTQEGTPIDRMVGAIARTFGIDQNRAQSLRPERGRSYFLEQLIKTVILGEAMLIDRNPGVRRRRMVLQVATWSVAALLLLGGTAALLVGWQRNAASASRFDTAVAVWRGQVERTPLSPVAAADLHRVLPLLDQARALPFGPDSSDATGWTFGMNQDATLRAAASLLYRQSLERILLPRLFWRAEQRVREHMNAPDHLYEHTRIYLMFGSQGPLDAGMIRDWAVADWTRALYPGAAQAPLREALLRHLDALLGEPLPEMPVDSALVDDARSVFSDIPLAARVYSVLRMTDTKARPWAPSEASGVGSGQRFVRRSGAPLTEPIPGLFTPDGFWTAILPSLPAAITRVGKETWVLGKAAGIDVSDPRTLPLLERDVIALYTQEYIARWTALLDDLDLVAPATPELAVADLRILSAQRSPIREILTAINKNLTLAPPAAPPAPSGGALGQAVAAVRDSALTRYLAQEVEPPGRAVDQHFQELRDFTERGLDTVLSTLRDLEQQLATQALGAPPIAGGNAAGALLTLATRRSPQPVKRWLTTIASGGRTMGSDLQRKAVTAAYNAGGGAAAGGGAPMPPPGPLCKAIERRYPLFADGADASMEDFSRLFAPGGSMDQFFTTQMRPFVAIQGNTWRPQAYMGTEPPVGAADVAAFQKIDRIRQAFFTFGATPRVTFLVRPVSADAETKKATLELGGQPVTFQAEQPTPPKMFEWPGPGGMTHGQVTFDPPPTAGSPNFASGTWALFRLFAKARRTGADEQFLLTFSQGQRQAVFEVQAGANNPFVPSLLRDFRCPTIGP
jgi:type VI secretion system protein ImpL